MSLGGIYRFWLSDRITVRTLRSTSNFAFFHAEIGRMVECSESYTWFT